jgi:hypothetical protein
VWYGTAAAKQLLYKHAAYQLSDGHHVVAAVSPVTHTADFATAAHASVVVDACTEDLCSTVNSTCERSQVAATGQRLELARKVIHVCTWLPACFNHP